MPMKAVSGGAEQLNANASRLLREAAVMLSEMSRCLSASKCGWAERRENSAMPQNSCDVALCLSLAQTGTKRKTCRRDLHLRLKHRRSLKICTAAHAGAAAPALYAELRSSSSVVRLIVSPTESLEKRYKPVRLV